MRYVLTEGSDMTTDDKIVTVIGLMAVAPISFMAAVEPERFWLFCRVFAATVIGVGRVVGLPL